jgi:hypothetical protein
MQFPETCIGKLATTLCVAVLLVLIYDAVKPERLPEPPPQPPEQDCIGEAVLVNYPYRGTVEDPHACLPQCSDGKQRYILYTNGKATQCEDPPGCNDYGEDRGITCRSPSSLPAR